MFPFSLLPQNRLLHRVTLTALVVSLLFLGSTPHAQAGCGCDKPLPEPALVRPQATYAGTDITLFHASLQTGQAYEVTFTSGITGESAAVTASAVTRRDIADGAYKPQLVVPLPELPLGPTSISVRFFGQDEVLMAAPDDALTVAPQPILVSEATGKYQFHHFQAAVSRDGTVYLSLDLSQVTEPKTFRT